MSRISTLIKENLLPKKKVEGRPVYLQENGEFLGKIKEEEDQHFIVDAQGVEMRFSSDDLIEGDGGFIYRPPWFGEASELLASLQARRAGDPELFRSTSIEQLDPGLRSLVEDAKRTARTLSNKRSSMREEKDEIEDEKATLSRIKAADIGRREYAKRVVDLDRRSKILEINLSRVEDLLSRFERIPFIDLKTIEDKAVSTVNEEETNKPERRRAEGERIKKIRILKLEKNLAEQQVQVAEGYIKDRLNHINGDIKDLKALASENQGNEKVLNFLRTKLSELREEKKELQSKLENIEEVSEEDVEKAEADLPEVVETEPKQEDISKPGMDMSLITRVGALIFILGLVIVLAMSLLGYI